MVKKGKKLKLTQYIQIYKNNDPLSQNLVNKYVLSDLLKLEMVLDFRINTSCCRATNISPLHSPR